MGLSGGQPGTNVDRLTHLCFDMMTTDAERGGGFLLRLPIQAIKEKTDANVFTSEAELLAGKLAPTTLQG